LNVVTRFAPSPTGHLHIGGARTAIFSWLLARHFGGKFYLRIEDTDQERSRQEYTDSILASMNWLGLEHDGEVAYQSQRLGLYSGYVDKLLASGHAYWCDCTPEEVEAMREEARSKGAKPRYNGRCRELGLGPGTGRAVRLKVPRSGAVSFDDLVKGHISVDASELDDMVLRRADGAATYNMAVVVDDAEMGVTHVVRGDDHVNNTPKQILIYRALGLTEPVFGHVPMILGPDRQKLSKRHGAKAVIEYQADGLLPEALLNYLVRLGWSHGDQEIFSRPELVEFFDGTSLNGSAAGFDPEKLLWVNAQHLHKIPAAELALLLVPFLLEAGLKRCEAGRVARCIPLFQTRSSSLKELAEQLMPVLLPAGLLLSQKEAVEKTLPADLREGREHVARLREIFAKVEPFAQEGLHAALQKYVADNGLKFKAVAPPLRVSLLGYMGGPDLAAVMEAIGRPETLHRMEHAATGHFKFKNPVEGK
jgi:glutamyl-tRNA synthetase